MDPESNCSMLTRAAIDGNYEELCEILTGSSFDIPSINQALYQAVLKSQSASDHLRCVETLLSHSGNPNFKDSAGISLLMIAARLGQIQLAELLINCGSLVEDKDKESRTPLMYAVESCYGDNVDVVKFLLEKKAKVCAQDNQGNSALHRSAERGYVDSMQVLLEFGAFINAENKDKETSLHLACKKAFENCVELLIGRKANPRLLNIHGKTPVDLAPDHIRQMFEAPQDCNSDSSFCSVSSHNEIVCKICKKIVSEGICKFCHENNLQYNIQTFQENRKLIEEYAKELVELKNLNVELNKRLKTKTEHCNKYKIEVSDKEMEIKKREMEIRTVREKLRKKAEECEQNLAKLKESKLEIESLKEQVANSKAEAKLLRKDCEGLRKRIEESTSEAANSANRRGKFSFLAPTPLGRQDFNSQLKSDIVDFMVEIEKWQEEAELTYTDLTTRLKKLIKSLYPTSSIEIYGSYMTRLHLPSSDIDMVILDADYDKREVLRSLERSLKSLGYIKSTNLILQATVPVIKISAELNGRAVQIDVTVSDTNHSGIQCLGVVNRLLAQSEMIRPIFIILKQLLYQCGFKEPYTGGLGSYSLFLMVASFIQKRKELNNIVECFVSVLEHFADENSYCGPIITNDPKSEFVASSTSNGDSFNPYTKLIIVDPLNSLNNVAFSTDVHTLINIFKTAHYNLRRINFCGCVFSSSPLRRMIFETKEYINN